MTKTKAVPLTADTLNTTLDNLKSDMENAGATAALHVMEAMDGARDIESSPKLSRDLILSELDEVIHWARVAHSTIKEARS